MWGTTSPAYVSRIIGEFPDISNDTLIMPRWIEVLDGTRDTHVPSLTVQTICG